MRAEAHRAVRILRVVEEAEGFSTLYFRDALCRKAQPGQFIMVWPPGMEEVPMSLSTIGGESSITVKAVGPTSRRLTSLGEGDLIMIRGPFGRGFTLIGEKPLLVAGGIGVAPLKPLLERMLTRGLKPTLILGAGTRDRLIFLRRFRELLGDRLHIATDDGSLGYRGLASEYAENLLEEHNFDIIYACGPEGMMAAVYRAAERFGLPIQVSLERYMKCAVGLCGSCAIGPYRVCRDGPVFDGNMLRRVLDEFGHRRLDPSGKPIPLERG
ncbi:dihydroorotate dehydrogenase electron transfer subunit [Candidatus Bathyarchaeota archaeon]|nr:MAG: dihydroorotate dehydrogenase electron transfer subunit [Candidatus Bathyarchaeota archaeon]